MFNVIQRRHLHFLVFIQRCKRAFVMQDIFRYSLEPKTPLFDIDATGTIRTKTLLDREEKAQYLLKVVATDGGVPPLSSTTLVNVILTDVNDNKPHFTQKMYNRIFPRPISG